MKFIVQKSTLSGAVEIPASKSHTIRALIIATLAEGKSTIRHALDSADTRACVAACEKYGARVELGDTWRVTGVGSRPNAPDNIVDVANSGTTMYFILGTAALSAGYSVITGDDQTRRRPAQNLIASLNHLGAEAFSTRGNGCAPIIVRGRLKGGAAKIACPTSQYISSLLLCCPLAEGDSEIEVTELNEKPYVEMTLGWLTKQGMDYSHDSMARFHIPGGQAFEPFQERICGDFSSATFFLVAAAVTGSTLTLKGLDMNDSQGDKNVVNMLQEMGIAIKMKPNELSVEGGELRGRELDLNATPDALPALAVAGCFAKGTTRLVNVPQARIKETDRIRAMRTELNALGGKVRELKDGLVIEGKPLNGGKADGGSDHRIVMALAVAGLASKKPIEIATAEAVSVTFPTFADLMRSCGAKIAEVTPA